MRKNFLGVPLIISLSIVPTFLWWLSFKSRPDILSFISLGQIASLTGTVLLGINFILSTRIKFIESLFDGQNKVYIYHHLVGSTSFILLLLHPVAVGLSYAKSGLDLAFGILFPPILSGFATWFGLAALLNMIVVLALTLYIKLPYEIWKFTHKFMGITLLLASVHVLFIESTITVNIPLRVYLLTFLTAGFVSYFYRTIFGRILIKKYKYEVLKSIKKGNITEVTLKPTSQRFSYLPGQFIFINFKSSGVKPEEHPFSLTSVPGEKNIKIAAKTVGDFTQTLKLLKKGAVALVEGPFGAFSHLLKIRKKQVWIAGGIGITPFLSMAKSLKAHDGFKVFLYYIVKTENEASYLESLRKIGMFNKNFKVTVVYSQSQGRLTADLVKKEINDLHQRDILICGPLTMMKDLRSQFKRLGIGNQHIFSEEFTLN